MLNKSFENNKTELKIESHKCTTGRKMKAVDLKHFKSSIEGIIL